MQVGYINGVVFSGVYLPPVNGVEGHNGKSKQRAEQLQREFVSEGKKATLHPVDVCCGEDLKETKQVYLVVTGEDIALSKAIKIQTLSYKKALAEYQQLSRQFVGKTEKVPNYLLQKQATIYKMLDELKRLNQQLKQKCPELERLFVDEDGGVQ